MHLEVSTILTRLILTVLMSLSFSAEAIKVHWGNSIQNEKSGVLMPWGVKAMSETKPNGDFFVITRDTVGHINVDGSTSCTNTLKHINDFEYADVALNGDQGAVVITKQSSQSYKTSDKEKSTARYFYYDNQCNFIKDMNFGYKGGVFHNHKIHPLSKQSHLITGHIDLPSKFSSVLFIGQVDDTDGLKTSKLLNIDKNIGEGINQKLTDSLVTLDGHIILVGHTQTSQNKKGFVLKLNQQFETVWQKDIPLKKRQHLTGISEDTNGDLYLIGYSSNWSTEPITKEGLIATVTKDGHLMRTQWLPGYAFIGITMNADKGTINILAEDDAFTNTKLEGGRVRLLQINKSTGKLNTKVGLVDLHKHIENGQYGNLSFEVIKSVGKNTFIIGTRSDRNLHNIYKIGI